MRLNQNKCILLGMNSLGSVQYLGGGLMPTAERAPYLGTNMSAKGIPHFEISTRMINTTTTLKTNLTCSGKRLQSLQPGR